MGSDDDIRRLRFAGELDLNAARGLGAMLSEAVGDSTSQPVVDLTEVSFVDSTALGALVKAAEQLRRQGRSLVLLLGPGPVAERLEIAGLADAFETFASEDAALQALRAAPPRA